MKQYEKYKDSGIEWLGDIPEHWVVNKISRAFAEIGSGTTPATTNTDYYNKSEVNWLVTGDLNDGYITSTTKKISQLACKELTTLRIYPKHSVVIAMYGATIGKLGYLQIATTTNQACCVINESENIEQRYLFYFLSANKKHIVSLSYGGGQPNISQEVIKQLPITQPIIAEQQKIAEYLDYTVEQVDVLVKEKEELINKLQEKRKSLINEVVTKGLNPDAPMRDSGIEWLGEIPEHWQMTRLRFLCDITTGTKDTENKIEDGEYPFYVRSQTVERINSYGYDGEGILTAGDGVGVCKVWHYVNGKFDFHQRVYMLYNFKNIYSKYLFEYIRANFINDVLKLSAKSTVDSLRLPMFQNFVITYPNNIEEQTQIVTYIEERTSKIDKISEDLKAQISKLKEYKTSIISEAVTGKIDLREWVKPI